jgi:hypothetical protein
MPSFAPMVYIERAVLDPMGRRLFANTPTTEERSTAQVALTEQAVLALTALRSCADHIRYTRNDREWIDAAEYLAACTHPRGPGVDCPLPRRRHPYPHLWFVHLPSGSEHAARSASSWPRCDIDDTLFAVRKGNRSGTRLAARRALVCSGANRLPDTGITWRDAMAER